MTTHAQTLAQELLDKIRQDNTPDNIARTVLSRSVKDVPEVLDILMGLPGKPLRDNTISDVHRMALWEVACDLGRPGQLAGLMDAMTSGEIGAINLVSLGSLRDKGVRQEVIAMAQQPDWERKLLISKITGALQFAINPRQDEVWREVFVDLVRAGKKDVQTVHLGWVLSARAENMAEGALGLDRARTLLTDLLVAGGDLEGDIHGSYITQTGGMRTGAQARQSIVHPGLLAYSLFMWQRAKNQDAWEELTGLVVEMGADWRKLLNGPDTTEEVKDWLRRVPGVRRVLLEERVERQDVTPQPTSQKMKL